MKVIIKDKNSPYYNSSGNVIKALSTPHRIIVRLPHSKMVEVNQSSQNYYSPVEFAPNQLEVSNENFP